ncbi:hypothetical protein OAD42_02910 [Oceanospirillaceae bacterium]|nr:hypothetical protein [Oceanospirillaceae bacterium]
MNFAKVFEYKQWANDAVFTHGSKYRGMASRVLAANNLDRSKDTEGEVQ